MNNKLTAGKLLFKYVVRFLNLTAECPVSLYYLTGYVKTSFWLLHRCALSVIGDDTREDQVCVYAERLSGYGFEDISEGSKVFCNAVFRML